MVESGLSFIGRVFVLLQLIAGIRAWGKEGHYATCKIAQGLLTEDAAAAVELLLPEYAKGDLASVCSWPDEIKYNYHWRWTSPLHWVDTPDFRCNYDYCNLVNSRGKGCEYSQFSVHLPLARTKRATPSNVADGSEIRDVKIPIEARDCHDSANRKDRCVTGAIYNYSMQLTTYEGSVSELKYNLTEALLFLSHYIGDVHQPLHVGFLGDEGGNTITVHWYRRKSNLHHVWDTMIIESALKTFYNSDLSIMIQAIERNITKDWLSDTLLWGNCSSASRACPDPYASESIKLACKYAYRNATPGSTLTDAYFLSRLPVVEKRLAQGGVRLAATLNRVFSTKPSIISQPLSKDGKKEIRSS